jgi:hypothetical protein
MLFGVGDNAKKSHQGPLSICSSNWYVLDDLILQFCANGWYGGTVLVVKVQVMHLKNCVSKIQFI